MKNLVKIVLISLTFPVMVFLGGILVYVASDMDQTIGVRLLIAGSGVFWAVTSIMVIVRLTGYQLLIHDYRNDRQKVLMPLVRNRYPDYEELYQKYPLAVTRHERHYRRDEKFHSNKEIIKLALDIDEAEWQARERHQQFRKEEAKGQVSEEEAPQQPGRGGGAHI